VSRARRAALALDAAALALVAAASPSLYSCELHGEVGELGGVLVQEGLEV
jgi:hypothetical protein